MNELPRLRVELEGVKQNVQHLFAQNHDALLDMVSNTLEKTLRQEWVQDRINEEVTNCVREAIHEVAGNYDLRNAITNLIAEQITKLIDRTDKGESS